MPAALPAPRPRLDRPPRLGPAGSPAADAALPPSEVAVVFDPARPEAAARALRRLLGLRLGDEPVVLAVATGSLRTEPLAPDARLAFGPLALSLAEQRATLDSRPLDLTPVEFGLLAHLARHPGRAFSRMELLDAVWGYEYVGYSHTVNSHVNRLRAKIEADSARPVFVQTVRGVGYRFGPIPTSPPST